MTRIANPTHPFAVEWPGSPLGSYFASYDNLSETVEALAYAGREPLCVIEGLNGDVEDVTDAVLEEVKLYRQDAAEQRAHDAGARRMALV